MNNLFYLARKEKPRVNKLKKLIQKGNQKDFDDFLDGFKGSYSAKLLMNLMVDNLAEILKKN